MHDTQESRNVSDLIRKSQLQVSIVQMEAIRHYIGIEYRYFNILFSNYFMNN